MRTELMHLPEPQRRFRRRGHAGQPGSGPAGKTCGDCLSLVPQGTWNRKWFKCALLRHAWTGGTGTDIRRRDFACQHFQAAEAKNAE